MCWQEVGCFSPRVTAGCLPHHKRSLCIMSPGPWSLNHSNMKAGRRWGGTRPLGTVWGALPAFGAVGLDSSASFPPTIQLHPVYAARHRLALFGKLPSIRDGQQGRPGLSDELTVGFGGAPKGHLVLAKKVARARMRFMFPAHFSSSARIHSGDR